MTDKPGTRTKNPYRPGAAVTPTYLAGRGAEVRRFVRALRNAPETPANIRITGLRGAAPTGFEPVSPPSCVGRAGPLPQNHLRGRSNRPRIYETTALGVSAISNPRPSGTLVAWLGICDL